MLAMTMTIIKSFLLKIASMKPQATCTLALLTIRDVLTQPVFRGGLSGTNITVVVPFQPGGAFGRGPRGSPHKFSERSENP